MGTKKASATGIAKSAKGQATAAAVSSKPKKKPRKMSVNARKVATARLRGRGIGRYRGD
jgi:hypothetical protein